MNIKKTHLFSLVLAVVTLTSCTHHPSLPATYTTEASQPDIYPDYRDVVVPPNIAPLNFGIRGDIDQSVARFTYAGQSQTYGSDNKIIIDEGEWKAMLAAAKGGDIKVEVFTESDGTWTAWQAFTISVAEEDIDPYVSYRLIFPSYVAYEMLSINQRDLTSFDESEIYNNFIISGEADGQCINCHSYQNYHTQNMQFHMRQGHGGTMIVHDGTPTKVNLKTDSTISAGVYPSWHPTLPLVAYSTNHTGQSFHTKSHAKIEVQDIESDIILYDVEKNEVRDINALDEELECFPTWSPDGKTLYFCSAHFEYHNDSIAHETEMIERFREVKYDIYRKSFDPQTLRFGDAEKIYEASADSMSATFPRVSPDGRYLLFGRAEFGCFHVWHPDADLYIMDLNTMHVRKLENVNSTRAESFHAWSSNGRWMVFISRRDDSNYSRLYFAYFDKSGHAHKAFEMPQRDPDFYTYFMRSYNVPEFMVEPVGISAQEFASAAKKDPVQAKFISTDAPKGKKTQKEAEFIIN